jgi:hypothetical protein
MPVGLHGHPGVRSLAAAAPKIVFRQGVERFLPGGLVIDGVLSRDPGNAGDPAVLRAGLLMGTVTASGKAAPCVVGTLQQAEVATATSVTLTAAQAVELVRRIGATGTLRLVGPPTAAGAVDTFTETYSAVNTATGVVTVTTLNADLIAGSFVCADDGSHVPLSVIDEGSGVKVTDADGNSLAVSWPRVPVKGVITPSQLVPWPSDTSLQAWVMNNLSTASAGKFTFDAIY